LQASTAAGATNACREQSYCKGPARTLQEANMYCTQCGTQNPDDAKFCHHCGTGLVAEGALAPVAYAGFWRRFVAYVIDRLILGIPSGILVLVFLVPSLLGMVKCCCDPECIPFGILSFVVSWVWLILVIVAGHLLYFAWFESSRFQATPGKMLLGIVVTDVKGQRVWFLRALGRNLGKIISHMIFNIGFLMAGVTARKQALHDMLADCLLVMKVRK
jgi:uncharacterized RDD family membrane protein YckC